MTFSLNLDAIRSAAKQHANPSGDVATAATAATTATKTPQSVASVASVASRQRLETAANDPAHHPPELAQGNAPTPDPARWCWPHSTAMNPAEINTFLARQRLFLSRGASADMAEALADRMVQRDREGDDRGLCLECQHLRGSGPYRCAVPRRADLRQPDLPRVLALTMQRCPAANPIPLTKGQP